MKYTADITEFRSNASGFLIPIVRRSEGNKSEVIKDLKSIMDELEQREEHICVTIRKIK